MKQEVHGNLEGLRDSLIAELAGLYEWEEAADSFLSRELSLQLARFTGLTGREIALYLTRDGEVVDVSVGTDRDVELTDYRLRRNALRLSGVRCVHTHPGGDGRLSDVDVSALRSFRYDAMCALGVRDGQPTSAQAGFLLAGGEVLLSELERWHHLPDDAWMRQIADSDREVGQEEQEEANARERAVLMGIDGEESLQELARLAETAGAEVVGSFLQKRGKPDSALFIGSGRAEELARDCQALEADLCIFDEELSGIQQRNLEQVLRVKVVDRTTLILDIFAQRASSAEGKLQVELAQLQYRSTRLLGQGLVLSRLAGGIGTRGPGESKLEISRRRIRERQTVLRRRLDEVERQRAVRRKNRQRNELPVVALVGYTNSGKSTLLNHLTGAGVYEADQLFATLDAVGRRMETAEHTAYLLVDTVGFIRKLPHSLVSAFRSTLEEAALADVLVIVNDGASPQLMAQHDTVEQVLEELGAMGQPRIEAINKCDLGEPVFCLPGAVHISARTGQGLDELQRRIADALQQRYAPVTLFVPFSDFGAVSRLRELGRVVQEEYSDGGVELTLVMSQDALGRVARYLKRPDGGENA